jgi:hypothetical protein
MKAVVPRSVGTSKSPANVGVGAAEPSKQMATTNQRRMAVPLIRGNNPDTPTIMID